MLVVGVWGTGLPCGRPAGIPSEYDTCTCTCTLYMYMYIVRTVHPFLHMQFTHSVYTVLSLTCTNVHIHCTCTYTCILYIYNYVFFDFNILYFCLSIFARMSSRRSGHISWLLTCPTSNMMTSSECWILSTGTRTLHNVYMCTCTCTCSLILRHQTTAVTSTMYMNNHVYRNTFQI